jgi:SAM-dependent methyltransferase
MGIGLSSFRHLTRLAAKHPPGPDAAALMLGRQKFRLVPPGPAARRAINTADARPFDAALQANGLQGTAMAMIRPDGYAEGVFEGLGYTSVKTLDFSAYEGADLIWDLNEPVPDDWHGRFSLIFDGGTLEHVFDVRQSFRNVYDMLAPGGIFASATPLNNMPGHGFYQFTPELVWSYWRRTAGCAVLRCHSYTRSHPHIQDFPDPEEVGGRLTVNRGPRRWGLGPREAMLMFYAVQKPQQTVSAGQRALQSDYTTRWKQAEAS